MMARKLIHLIKMNLSTVIEGMILSIILFQHLLSLIPPFHVCECKGRCDCSLQKPLGECPCEMHCKCRYASS